VTVVYVLLWLISSSAWADAVSKIKVYTDPKEYFDDEYACECYPASTVCAQAKCHVTKDTGFATLNVSIVSGQTVSFEVSDKLSVALYFSCMEIILS